MRVWDRIASYLVGKYGVGWTCSSCDRAFLHDGKPRRTYLAVIDHVVLDHGRLPTPYSAAHFVRHELISGVWTATTNGPNQLSYTVTGFSVLPLVDGGETP